MRTLVIATAMMAAAASIALAQTAPPPGARPAGPPPGGGGPSGAFAAYLPAGTLGPALVSLPPAEGSPADIADRASFKATRAMQGGPRWALATSDSGRGVLKAFSCSAGVLLDDKNAPSLVKLLTRMRTDQINLTRPAAGALIPARPFARDTGPVCIATDKLGAEWPSLQSAWGYSIGMILAEALPGRASVALTRGRAMGDSAAICGTVSVSAVTAGREAAGAALARLRADPAFAADLAAAKMEIAAAAKAGPAPADCAQEAAAIASR